MLVDTHCHIHEANYPLDIGDVMNRAHHAGVGKMLVVGTDMNSSYQAVDFAKNHQNVWASIGVHPHDTKDGYDITKTYDESVIAVGEIGLDYYYTHSPRDVQIAALESQFQFVQDKNLPVIFHVRDAFDDFWPVYHNFSGVRGVLHSFTDNAENLEKALSEGLYIGLNGISTFTKDVKQQAVFDSVPLDNMLLETDAPFLTPVPKRGKVNEPAFVRLVAEYHANRRQISFDDIADATTQNATTLFGI